MKQSLALCAALIAAAGVATKAQDRKSEINPASAQDRKSETNPAPTTPAPVSESENKRAQASPSPAVAPPEAPDDLRRRLPKPDASRLTVCLECPSPTTFLTPPLDGYDSPARPRDTPAGEPPGGAGKETDAAGEMKFQWRPALEQSLLFLGVQHGYALTQPKTRRDLRGPFFKDYFRSVKSLHGWADGGRFFTNYVAHPMQGSLLGFIQIQNDPKGVNRRFGKSGAYWRSRLKSLAWSAAWSTQFEIGPASQASIGNVGLHGKQTYVDLVVTPTAGLGLLVAEDVIDKYVLRKLERNSGNFYIKIAGRMILNPTRTVANLMRFKKPWHRDGGLR